MTGNKVLIKRDEGRYLVKVLKDPVKRLGIDVRGNKKNVNSFKTLTLMNKMYGFGS